MRSQRHRPSSPGTSGQKKRSSPTFRSRRACPARQCQKAIMPRRNGDLAGGLGLRPGPALRGRARPAYQIPCALSPMKFGLPAPAKSHDEAEDGTIFQGGEVGGTDLTAPAPKAAWSWGRCLSGAGLIRRGTANHARDVPLRRGADQSRQKSPRNRGGLCGPRSPWLPLYRLNVWSTRLLAHPAA
jgi:hypothetical protein